MDFTEIFPLLIAFAAVLTIILAFFGGLIKRMGIVITISVLIAAASIVSISGKEIFDFQFKKSDTQKIEECLNSFLDAYNNGDLNKALECMDSKLKNTLNASINISNALIGKTGFKISLVDLFGLSVGLISEDKLLTAEDVTINILSEDTAILNAFLTYEDTVSPKSNISAEFEMKKEKGDWFISDLNQK